MTREGMTFYELGVEEQQRRSQEQTRLILLSAVALGYYAADRIVYGPNFNPSTAFDPNSPWDQMEKTGVDWRFMNDRSVISNILSYDEAEEYAWNSIKGPNKADAVVLGKYMSGSPNSYDAIAHDMDAQYFNLENWDELTKQYSKEEIWKINKKFLDIEISSGRDIYLSHNPDIYMGDGSFIQKKLII